MVFFVNTVCLLASRKRLIFIHFIYLSLLIYTSQFEEKFDDINGVEPPVSFPIASGSGSNEQSTTEMVTGHSRGKEIEPRAQQAQVDQTNSDINASQEFAGGMMKIVPSDVDVSIIILMDLFSFN